MLGYQVSGFMSKNNRYKQIALKSLKIIFSVFILVVIVSGVDSINHLKKTDFIYQAVMFVSVFYVLFAVWNFKISSLYEIDKIQIKIPFRLGKKIHFQDLYIMPWHKGYLRILNKEQLNLLKENLDLESKGFLSYVSKIELEEDLFGGFYFVLPKELCEHFNNRSTRVVENELGLMIN